jgi:hypothetical protein
MTLTKLPSVAVTNASFRTLFDSISPTDLSRAELWYPSANDSVRQLAERFGKSVPVVTGIVARLSPSIRWDRNLIAASKLLEGKNVIDGYSRNKKVAEEIRDGLWGNTDCSISFSFPKTSPKIFCFYHNILHPYTSTHITIDRWMIRAAHTKEVAKLLDAEIKVTRQVYLELQQRIINFALDNQVNPVAMQAALWTQIRDTWTTNTLVTV